MKIIISVGDVKVNVHRIASKAENDPAFWTFAATEWHRLYKDYVPMNQGDLYNKVTIVPKEITHNAPYAHYQYEGNVYGPNIPIMENGTPVGFFSPPGKPKSKTGRKLKYSKALHPKASAKWDKAAAPTQLPKLAQSLQNYIDSGRLNLD